MNLGLRIKQRRNELGLTQEQLAQKAGVSQGIIATLETRNSKKSNYSNSIANALGVTHEWLSEGITPKENLIPQGNTVAVLGDNDYSQTHQQISMYDIRLSAGGGNAVNPNNLKGMYVRGDSMEPYLFNHDTVLIDIDDTEIADGEVYALIFKDKFYVKELQNIDGEINIISCNDKYPSMHTQKDEADSYGNYFQVLGKVVWRGG